MPLTTTRWGIFDELIGEPVKGRALCWTTTKQVAGPNGTRMHSASTDERQSGRKRFQANGQLGDDPPHNGQPSCRKASTTDPPSRSGNVNQPGISGGQRLAAPKT